jgi:hypothetical protein
VEVFREKYKETWRAMTEKNEGEVKFTVEESSFLGLLIGDGLRICKQKEF